MPYLTTDQRFQLALQGAAFFYQHGAQRVWLFGSLAKGRPQDRRSDLDLLVEGLPVPLSSELIHSIRAQLTCHVDVLEMETLPPDLRHTILQGRVLLPCVASHQQMSPSPDINPLVQAPTRLRLNQQRLQVVAQVLEEYEVKRVLDLGCGVGLFLEMLATSNRYEMMVGIDFSKEALAEATNRFQRHLTPVQRNHIQLIQGLITCGDPRMLNCDAVVATEVIEHLDGPRRAAFEHVVFRYIHPKLVLITTPNAEYNSKLRLQTLNKLRREDHHFEWSRAEFHAWVTSLSLRYDYYTQRLSIGTEDPIVGAPTQMGIFVTGFG